MRPTPLVSIVMPLYNKRPYVKRAIESILHQTYPDWELIIIDDGSTDGSTAEIPQDDVRIKLFQQRNAGPALARNHGVDKAQGNLVTFIDADNYYYPYKLEKEITLLSEYKDVQWMISPFDLKLGKQTIRRSIKDINGHETKSTPLVIDNALNDLKIVGWHIEGLCTTKHLLQQLGGFHEQMRCYEVTEFFIRCALEQPNVLVYPRALYCVVDVPGSAYKVSSHRIEGKRHMAESLYNLSKHHLAFSDHLALRSQKSMFSYTASLIFLGKRNEARSYLMSKFPFRKSSKWCQLWVLTWAPKWIGQRVLHTRI